MEWEWYIASKKGNAEFLSNISWKNCKKENQFQTLA